MRNAGKSGERTNDGVNRLEILLNIYSLDYVLLLEGTNDVINGVSYKTTLNNLDIMVDKCIAHNVTPIIATLPPMKLGVSVSRGGYIDEIPRYYNPGIKSIASEKGIEVSDQYAALIGRWNKYSDDGIHPNEAGYSVMAKTWFDTVGTTITTIKPTVTAVTVSAIGESSATLNGVVNPNGSNTRCYFEYGVNASHQTDPFGKSSSTPAIDVGSGIDNVTVNAEITGLTPETTYYFRLVATNDYGTTSGNDQTFTTLSEPKGGGGGGCFIATAAYGSSVEPNVILLKEFRDKYLMVSEWGKKFVEFYYRTSPLIANIIANNESLKFVVRSCLYPLVGLSYLMINIPLEQKFFILGIFGLFVIGIGLFFVRVTLRYNDQVKTDTLF